MILKAFHNNPIKGEITLAGDKSISHRILMFSLFSKNGTHIQNLPNGQDVISTFEVLKKLGLTGD